ncbi:peptide deformylase [Heliophilum fasciatum]|uniref:Peptide deformylase n=1 Tax=Heliophilum fasciatum TaxID=35700 RepID=A0A4V2SXZ9_9FIRM|nr:peptide deformylase [Heliophilum fasciatum]MCW2277209.1 peptide deformylase [Heliophilum fasciatum]TCP68156.1 peptide deformylase [Heliophilum fasciatum]
MAVFEVVTIGDPVLREKAKVVQRFNANLGRLIDDMFETMHAAQGVGLAAPQIGISKRVVVIDIGKGPIELVNPEIVEAEGVETDEEGCLSVPKYHHPVERSYRVRVKGQDRHGNPVEIAGEGLLARALQHEIDHLEGILFVDRIPPEAMAEE